VRCGDLLAQFLLDNGIETYYVRGDYRDNSPENTQSHAWLVTYNQIIIDITGDQFRLLPHLLNCGESVYVGSEGSFHRQFGVEERDVHKNFGLDHLGCASQPRLHRLYRTIIRHLQI